MADDSQLIARAIAGDDGAADQLVRRYHADVYAVAWRVLGDVDMVHDAVQDAFINALRALRSFRGAASFRTWLLRIAVNSAHSAGRRSTRRREIRLDAAHESIADERDEADAVVQRSEASRVAGLLEQLPEKQRLAVTLRVQQGLSYREIGQVLDCSEGAARVNYHLGVKRLKELAQ